METLYKSDYLLVKFDAERNILFSYWTTPADMHDEEYRKEFETYEQIAIKLEPKNKFVNFVKSKYVIPVETHEWVTSKLDNLHKLYEIKKVAFIMSINFLAQLARELVTEEVKVKDSKTQFFDSEEKALAWLESAKNKNSKAA